MFWVRAYVVYFDQLPRACSNTLLAVFREREREIEWPRHTQKHIQREKRTTFIITREKQFFEICLAN